MKVFGQKFYEQARDVFASHMALSPLQEPGWSPEDIAAIATFFKTATGQKLALRMRYQEQANNALAILRMDRHEYACGFACGWRAHTAWLWSLSEVGLPEVPETVQNLEETAGELNERLSS